MKPKLIHLLPEKHWMHKFELTAYTNVIHSYMN